jgi:hypothetical protein
MVLDVGSAVGVVGTPLLLLVMILGEIGIDVLELGSVVGGVVGNLLLILTILGKLGIDICKIEEDGFC